MGRKKADKEESRQPLYVGDLLLNGFTVLSGKTREELVEKVGNLPKALKYAVGAIGRNPESGEYSLRVDIVNN